MIIIDLQCVRVYGCCICSVFPEDKYLGQSGGVEAVRNENARIAEEIQLLDQEMVRSFILVLDACNKGRCLFHWHLPRLSLHLFLLFPCICPTFLLTLSLPAIVRFEAVSFQEHPSEKVTLTRYTGFESFVSHNNS